TKACRTPDRKNTGTLCMVGTGVPNSEARRVVVAPFDGGGQNTACTGQPVGLAKRVNSLFQDRGAVLAQQKCEQIEGPPTQQVAGTGPIGGGEKGVLNDQDARVPGETMPAAWSSKGQGWYLLLTPILKVTSAQFQRQLEIQQFEQPNHPCMLQFTLRSCKFRRVQSLRTSFFFPPPHLFPGIRAERIQCGNLLGLKLGRSNGCVRVLPVVAAAAQAATHLVNQGFRAPAWDAAFADAAFPPDRAVEDGAGVDYLRGWQRRASRACEERALETHFPDLSPASQALLLLKPAYTPAVCLRSSPPPTMSTSCIPDRHSKMVRYQRTLGNLAKKYEPLPHHVLAPQQTLLMLPMPKPTASGGEHSRAPMVRRGEVPRARATLTTAAIAHGADEAFAALSDPERRPPVPLHDVPAAWLNLQPHDPDAPAVLNDAAVAQALRTARRGTAAGLSGVTCEHTTSCCSTIELFMHAANLLVAARVPANVAAALGLSRFTALREPGGGVRGILHASRRCRPRLCGDLVSLDGHSAYDTISRTAFLRKLHAVAPALIPFGEGCEQGDALAPALYALGQHDALVAAEKQLRPAKHVMTLRAPDAAHTDTRLLEQARLLQELPLLDLQCAWLLLAMCASPRADHLLRTLPPDLSASYVRGHDDAVWRGACRVKKTTLIPRFLAELAAGPAGCVLDGAGFLARNAICLNLARGAKVGSITVPAPTLPTFAELLPYLAQAMLRSQSGPHAAAWLSAIPSEAGFALPPDRMLIALRRRLRLPLPVAPHRCGAHGHGCGAAVDADGDHHAACPRTGLLARRAKPLEHAWVSIVREAVGPEGQV
ncbi:unnamed protein product, partial [Symbiodinium sp. KB8]